MLITSPGRGSGRVVLIGETVASGDPVELFDADRDRGVTVIGVSGSGKSTLLERMILTDLETLVPVVVIDPHDTLTQRVLSLVSPKARERILLLEQWPDTPYRINLLECPEAGALDRTVETTIDIFKKLFGSAGKVAEYLPRMERDLSAAARTVVHNAGTLADIPRLFADPQIRSAFLDNVPDDDEGVFEYWDYYQRLGREAEQAKQIEAVTNRLQRLLDSRTLRRLVDSPDSSVPFEHVLAGPGAFFLHIPISMWLAEYQTDFIGALFLSVLTDRIFLRGANNPPPLHLYLDEYGRFATRATASLFTQGRKHGVGLTIAHQNRTQIEDPQNRAAELDAGTLILLRLNPKDAAELATAFDTTPVRTKTTTRQRTRPVYREWDEEVWEPPEAQAEHAAVAAELATLKDTLGAELERCKAGYAILERAYGEPGAFARLMVAAFGAKINNKRDIHLPFNPDYFFDVWCWQTVGGLRKVGEPDFWHPDYPAELRSRPCEGYVLKQKGELPEVKFRGWQWVWSKHTRTIHPLRSRLVAELDRYHGPFGDVAADLKREVAAMLDAEYQKAIFWFSPGTLDYARIRSGSLSQETVDRLTAEEEWLARTRPGLGQERPLRLARRPILASGDGQVPVVGWEPIVDPEQWPKLGSWQLTAFPRAVRWLNTWALARRVQIEVQQGTFDEKRRLLEERLSSLKQAHFKIIHHKEYLGDLPEKHEWWWTSYRTQYTRAGVVREPTDHRETEQWYDPVEELDQTHADRELEIANALKRQPVFQAWCRTAQGEYQVRLVSPERVERAQEGAIEQVRQRSRTLIGRPDQPARHRSRQRRGAPSRQDVSIGRRSRQGGQVNG